MVFGRIDRFVQKMDRRNRGRSKARINKNLAKIQARKQVLKVEKERAKLRKIEADIRKAKLKYPSRGEKALRKKRSEPLTTVKPGRKQMLRALPEAAGKMKSLDWLGKIPLTDQTPRIRRR